MGVFPRYQNPCKHVQSFPTESYLMVSRFSPRCTSPRCSSSSPLRAPVWTLFLLCLRSQLEYTAHKMQLWLVPFKTTGTDTFVKHNTYTRPSGHGVQTCLYLRDEFPFLTPKSFFAVFRICISIQRLGKCGSLYTYF